MPGKTGISRRGKTGTSRHGKTGYSSSSSATEPFDDYSSDPQVPEWMAESKEWMEDPVTEPFDDYSQERKQARQHQIEQQRQKQQEQQQQLRRRRRQDVGSFEAEQRMAGRRRSELRSALEQQATLFDILGLAQQERRRTMG